MHFIPPKTGKELSSNIDLILQLEVEFHFHRESSQHPNFWMRIFINVVKRKATTMDTKALTP
jgi:hypothetical protein